MKKFAGCLLALALLVLCAGGSQAYEPSEGEIEASPPEYAGDEAAARPIVGQAHLAYQERRYVEAARLYERAYETHQHPRSIYNVGQCYRAAGRWQEAVAAYRQRLDLEPAPYTFIHTHIGTCLLELNQREQANEAFRRYLELDPNGDCAAQARQAIETGEWPEDQDRRPAETVEQAREVHTRAERLCEEGEFREAAEAYLEGYERFSNVHELLLNAAVCFGYAGEEEAAIEHLRAYLQTPGAEPDAHAYLGNHLMTECLLAEALQEYERYLELDPQGGLAEQTRRTVRWIRRLNPMPTRANLIEAKRLWERGSGHARAGRVRAALRDYESAYQIIPDPTLHYNIGECHRTRERWADALVCYQDYIERMGDLGARAQVHLMAAACLIGLNRTDDAMEHIRAYRARADADELPGEEADREWAVELEEQCKSD